MRNDTPDNQTIPIDVDVNDFFDNALSGYIITDSSGTIIKANKSIAKWLSCSQDQLPGKRVSDLLTVGGKIYYETHLWPLLQMQGFFDEVALELSCNNHDKLPVLVNALERKNPEGRTLCVWLTIFKAKDRRTYEQNLKNSKNSLEISLANAHQVTTLREQFIAILGHDLRNPVGSIIAGAALLDRSDLPEQNKKILQGIKRSALRMAELINNIMDFARTRLGEGIVIDRRLTKMESVLQPVVDEIRTIYPSRQIEVYFHGEAMVLCDGPRIAQLLSNLLANAITHGYTDTPVRVTVMSDEQFFELNVCNAGKQIPTEHIERLFEPFTRESHHASQNGLGLGLYIASQIAKAHNANLSVTSTSAETCFKLYFAF